KEKPSSASMACISTTRQRRGAGGKVSGSETARWVCVSCLVQRSETTLVNERDPLTYQTDWHSFRQRYARRCAGGERDARGNPIRNGRRDLYCITRCV